METKKSTLHKDLDKFWSFEKATSLVARGFVAPGLALLFIILVMVIATAFVAGSNGAWLIVAAAAVGGYMALNIGANDVANNVGPAVGSRAMTMGTALIIAAVFESSGA